MKDPDFEGPIKEAFVELQRYVDLQIKYNKILFAKKLGDLSSYFVLFLLIIGVSGFALLFLSLSFVNWYEEFVSSRFHASLIVTLFYLLLATVIIVFRKSLIFNPIKRLLGGIVTEEDDKGNQVNPFKSEKKLRRQLKKCRDEIEEEQNVLREKFGAVSDSFTIGNIFQSVAKSFYDSYITTSNIAKAAMLLVTRIKGGRKKKPKKKRGGKNTQLEENID